MSANIPLRWVLESAKAVTYEELGRLERLFNEKLMPRGRTHMTGHSTGNNPTTITFHVDADWNEHASCTITVRDKGRHVLAISDVEGDVSVVPNYLREFGYVPLELPEGYYPIAGAPTNTLIHVCWGDTQKGFEFGLAKKSWEPDKWYKYGEANPHLNGRSCATPTGWQQ